MRPMRLIVVVYVGFCETYKRIMTSLYEDRQKQ